MKEKYDELMMSRMTWHVASVDDGTWKRLSQDMQPDRYNKSDPTLNWYDNTTTRYEAIVTQLLWYQMRWESQESDVQMWHTSRALSICWLSITKSKVRRHHWAWRISMFDGYLWIWYHSTCRPLLCCYVITLQLRLIDHWFISIRTAINCLVWKLNLDTIAEVNHNQSQS